MTHVTFGSSFSHQSIVRLSPTITNANIRAIAVFQQQRPWQQTMFSNQTDNNREAAEVSLSTREWVVLSCLIDGINMHVEYLFLRSLDSSPLTTRIDNRART
jgi:hypothetical protein